MVVGEEGKINLSSYPDPSNQEMQANAGRSTKRVEKSVEFKVLSTTFCFMRVVVDLGIQTEVKLTSI